jgi:GMP synthase (glutamine-hydrolysing)
MTRLENLFHPLSLATSMRVVVVDNGGQWTHREWRVLKYLGADTKIVPNDTPVSELQGVDGLVLSGGAPRVGVDASKMGRNGDYLDAIDAPILGICAGHQFMAKHFGGDAAPSAVPEFGKAVLTVKEPDVLFSGLPSSFEVWESHNDEVSSLPTGFVALASSPNCAVQAMRSLKRPLFGLQFHPEVENTQHGYDIFRNFLKVCEG